MNFSQGRSVVFWTDGSWHAPALRTGIVRRRREGRGCIGWAVAPLVEPLEPRTLLSGLVIIPVFDSSITGDPNAAAIQATINTAIQNFEQDFTTPITVKIEFEESTAVTLSGSSKASYQVSYTLFRNALVASATSADDTSSLVSVPAGADNPDNSASEVVLTTANARALGFSNAMPTDGIDGVVLLNMPKFNLTRTSIDPLKYDLLGSVYHEIDEVLGVESALNGSANGSSVPTTYIAAEDLFRYDATGGRSFNTSAVAAAYFSVDGGHTLLEQFNQIAGDDFCDWYNPGTRTAQVQDATTAPDATPNLGIELTLLDVLGYSLAPGVQGGLLPDLQPYQPPGWSAPLVVSTTSGSTIASTSITTAQDVYFTAATINWGEVATSTAYTTTYVLDGTTVATSNVTASLAVNSFLQRIPVDLGTLSAGSHTLSMNIDVGDTANETNVNNNTYSVTFNVQTAADFASISDGALTINGTAGDDIITLTSDGTNVTATLNGTASDPFALSSITSITVNGNAGNDSITVESNMPASLGVSVQGGPGDDTIMGGPGNDTLGGGAGNDSIAGGPGDDSIKGGAGDDVLGGGKGNDTLFGSLGNDTLRGGLGDDSLNGGAGANQMYGGQGNNIFYAVNGTSDQIFAGAATNDSLIYGPSVNYIIESGVIPPGNVTAA